MTRWKSFLICAVIGAGLLVCGLVLPAYVRAIDRRVVQTAGKNTTGLVEQGLALVDEKQFGAAQMLWQAAQQEAVPHREQLGRTLDEIGALHADWLVWGGGDSNLQALFKTDPNLPKSGSEPFTQWVVRLENRATALDYLNASTKPMVHELLQVRSLTNTTLFPPSHSSAGQALDAAVSTCGLLLEQRKLTPALSNSVYSLTLQATRGGSPTALEQVLLDLMALGQRLNWNQLEVFVQQVQDPQTLQLLTQLVRHSEAQLPVVFAAVQLTGDPAGVAHYLQTYSQTGLNDLGASLRFGRGATQELVRRNLQMSEPKFLPAVALDLCWHRPQFALALKWLLFAAAGFFFATALHFTWRTSALEAPLQVSGFHVLREILFAVGFLAFMLLLSEPYLAQESQKLEFPFRLRLATVASAVAAGPNQVKSSFMNQVSLLTLLLFFVLQGLLYIACLVKLAEIRRQRVLPRIKLKLLENEDHLFDAGLYLGFVGTIISLILVSLGVIKFSLMAAYSSTSFGIIFVSFFKIFHLRPLRRKLLLEAEAVPSEPEAPVGARLAPTI